MKTEKEETYEIRPHDGIYCKPCGAKMKEEESEDCERIRFVCPCGCEELLRAAFTAAQAEIAGLKEQIENARAAFGEHPDSEIELAQRISELRDSNRGYFHAQTKWIEDRDALRLRVAELENHLREIHGCFDAAEAEGFEVMLEDVDDDRLRDVYSRRLKFAHEKLSEICTVLTATAEPKDPSK